MSTWISCQSFAWCIFCLFVLGTSKPLQNTDQDGNGSFKYPHQLHQTHNIDNGPKQEARYKRSQSDIIEGSRNNNNNNNILGGDDLKDLNELMQDFNGRVFVRDLDKIMHDLSEEHNISPLIYLMLMEQLKQMVQNGSEDQLPTRRTPRLGRSTIHHPYNAIDLARGLEAINNNNNDYDLDGFGWQRIIKKSVPFKPRLGKRSQLYE